MSNEDLFICFILVALNSFLCSDSSLIPCYKYFGIFDDLENIKHLDWCGYILDWLLQGVKTFSRAKSISHSDGGTIQGCLFYLAVIYLDHVDFGARQLSNSIPRISVWKGSMLCEYADYDMKQPGCYGYHPLLDISRTCYSKDFRYLYNPSSLSIDDHFKESLDCHAGRPLSLNLKNKICQLIQNYCFNCGLSINLDVNSVSALPDDMKVIFCKLMQHAYSIDSRCQKLVLQLIKVFATSDADRDFGNSHVHTSLSEPPNPTTMSGRENDTTKSIPGNSVGDEHVYSPQYEFSEAAHISGPINKSNPANLQTPAVARVMEKLSNNNKGAAPDLHQTPSRFVPPPSGYTPDHPLHRKLYGKHDGSQAKISQPASHPPKVPLSDSTNSLSSEKRKKSVSFGADEDVILLDNNDLQYYVPDSLSPSPQPRLFRFRSQKLLFDKENVDPGLSQQAPIHIQSLDISPHSLSQTNCSASKANTASSSKSQSHIGRSLVNSQHKVCPDVQILAENTLGDNVRAMTQKSDALYNSKLRRSRCSNSMSDADLPLEPSGSRHISDYNTHSQPLISNDSSVSQNPIHGSRRLTKTHSVQHLESFSRTSNFHVTKSEVDNYKVICKLASSQFQCEDAVNLSGVRCTYWALGDSMKPGGKVKTFVVSAFYYSLFHKPNGHPDVSKRHYFFPNVADNLVKDINDADQDILARAFKRSSRALPLHRSEMVYF
ncbi:unnamed protein product [Urochloa humidicola]